MSKTNRCKKKNLVGFWILEAIVVLTFAGLLMNARAIRDAAADTVDKNTNEQVSLVAENPDTIETGQGWDNHRPRFSEVFGEIWDGGF